MTFDGPLVSADWLASNLQNVRLVDVRWYLDGRSGRAAYRSGHLPGAVWLDVDVELAGWASPAAGRHPLPSPAQFAAVLGRVGIAAGTPVVAYDDAGGSEAARLWWMLHVLGEPAAVLDGGMQAWTGSLETQVPDVVPVERPVLPWPAQRFVSADEVAVTGAAVYDARSAQRYAHGDPAIDPRPGHIPGAQSAPWAANLDGDGRLLAPARLREIYADALDRGGVAYCGSGVTACLDLLAMEVAGVETTALYAGSWSQWAAEPSRPAEEGLAP
ncbi:MAG: thiosulfate/3-mercaptopyruvate sulfurtransferase [Pseudonocardiales bacterium]|nr:thiosulfate/3-mercaptopyruvate sulfurtransferase [Pseudonocardiales bacterium]